MVGLRDVDLCLFLIRRRALAVDRTIIELSSSRELYWESSHAAKEKSDSVAELPKK